MDEERGDSFIAMVMKTIHCGQTTNYITMD